VARGFEVAVGADGRAFNQAIKTDVIKPLDQAAKSLDDLADAGEDAGRDSARGLGRLEDALKDAQRQSEKTERSLDDIGEGGSRGLGRVKEGAQEVQQEIGQNMGEAFSSFRGDIEDVGQIGQDTLGGLAAALAGTGPAGIVGAVGLAAGAAAWGTIFQSLQDQAEEAKKLRERLSDAYSSAVADGKNYLDTAYQIKDAQDVMFNPDRADEWKKLQDTQKETGLDMSTILQANAGDAAALDLVMRRVADANQAAADAGEEVNVIAGVFGDNLQHLNDYWKTLGTEAQTSQQKAADALDYTNDVLRKQIDAASDAGVEVDTLGNKLVTLGDGTEIFVDVETGKASLDVDKFKGDYDDKVEQMSGKKIIASIDADASKFDAVVRRIQRTNVKINGQVVYKSASGQLLQ